MIKISLTGGFEPPTFRLTAERSTDWATRASTYSLFIYIKNPGFSLRVLIIVNFSMKKHSYNR